MNTNLPKKVLEWREKNKNLLQEKIQNPRPWQEIMSDIEKWCNGVQNENKRNH
jgi:hypothetical protein